MFARKFMAAILALSLTCGGVSLVYADGTVSLVAFVDKNYSEMCNDPDLRLCCLMRILESTDESSLKKTESTDESLVREYEDYMLKNPEGFKNWLVFKLMTDPKFRQNYFEFTELCEKHAKAYEEFKSKRPKTLRWPPSWG